MSPSDLDVLIYAGVCREDFEPATACHVADALGGVGSHAAVYDLSNACLGVLNGIIDVANRIELGQCRAGLVVSCESARDINEVTIRQLNQDPTMERFRLSLATLTGGSGAVAVLVTDGSLAGGRRRLLGGANRSAPQHHRLCRWGLQSFLPAALPAALSAAVSTAAAAAGRVQAVAADAKALVKSGVDRGLSHLGLEALLPNAITQFTSTDAAAVLKYGVELGTRTWQAFAATLGWAREQVDRVICHQVGAGHRDAILKTLGIAPEKDFSTFPYLGNMGTVSLPLTAALAEEREFLRPGDRVGFLGIGSGLNCLMLGVQW
jgi:3-oxoacyl-[acyl-carrier-protein] synthase-3